MSTKIEWTEETWNPLVGCEHVSPGCDGCYAAREACGRLSAHPLYAGLAKDGRFTGEVRLARDRLDQPLRWRKPRTVFVNSMSDLFHRDVPDEFILDVWRTMGQASQHTFQVLTKRPQRMASWVGSAVWRGFEWFEPNRPLPNVWLGTSIESDRYAWRADHLRDTPAAVRFLSLEPLLGPLPSLDLTGIDWVIVGGESGPKARPMDPADVRPIRDACLEQRIPFFFKQWGEWIPYEDDVQQPFFSSQHGDAMFDGHHFPAEISDSEPCRARDGSLWWWPEIEGPVYRRVGKKAAGRVLDGWTWDEMPARAS